MPGAGEAPALRGEWYGYVVLAAGVMLHVCLGTVYTWGNLTTYLTSYMRRHDDSLEYSDTVWTYFVAPFAQGIFILIGGGLQYRLGPRLTAILGSLLFSGGVMLSSVLVKHSLPGLVMVYGVLAGTGLGFAYTCPLNVALQYMPHRRGLINGVVVGGFGIGAFLFNFFITAYVNPNNCKPVCPDGGNYTGYHCDGFDPNSHLLSGSKCADHKDKYFPPDSNVAGKVPELLFILGCMYLALTLLGSFFLVTPDEPFLLGLVQPQSMRRRHSPEEGGEEDSDSDETSVCGEGSEAVLTKKGGEPLLPTATSTAEVGTLDAMRTREAWQLFFGFMGTGIGGSFVIASYKSYGQDRDWSTDHFEQQVSSFMSIANALGRLVMGTAADRFGFVRVLVVMACLQTAVLFTFTVSGASKWLFLLWCVVCAFLYGGNFALYPTGTCEIFGRKYFPTNFGFVFMGFGCGSLLVSAVNQSLKDSIGFGGLTMLGGAMCGAGALNAIHLAVRKRK
eukprot:Hpha_TRINITY_DN16467_c1_g3::TRINITY_DN16467_c1_g3_i1::g.160818::m.160818